MILDNLVQVYKGKIYLDKDDSWTGILAAAEITIIYRANRLKFYTLGQLVFDLDIIVPIKENVNREILRLE